MTGKMDKTHSKELLKVEAHMSDTPKCLHLKSNKPPAKIVTYRPQPSSVLQRVQSFLPEIAKANDILKEKMTLLPPDAFDIENIDESSPGPHIEMNIAVMPREDSDSSSLSDMESSAEEGDDIESDAKDELSADILLSSSEKTKTEPAVLYPLDENNVKLPGLRRTSRQQAIEVLSDSSGLHKDHERSADFCDVNTVR